MNWRKSTYSASGGCVEVATMDDVAVLVRDTRDRGGTVLALAPGIWAAFTDAVKSGSTWG